MLFRDLGVCPELLDALERIGWVEPTAIQKEMLTVISTNKICDVVGVAETGSGKTGAFAIPALQDLLERGNNVKGVHTVVLSPTRELAVQTFSVFRDLGKDFGLRTGLVIGGVDLMQQRKILAQQPHALICTPGRLADHLASTEGFSLKSIRFLIIDEADKMLEQDMGRAVLDLAKACPQRRRTFLFSATFPSAVQALQNECTDRSRLVHIRVGVLAKDALEVDGSASTQLAVVDNELLSHKMVVLPHAEKQLGLVVLLNNHATCQIIVFATKISTVTKLALMLTTLGFEVGVVHGSMAQDKRLEELNRFRQGEHKILLASDVAGRGIDIPNVDLVINYDLPVASRDYVHRAGRTARAGRRGTALTIVTQYDVVNFKRIEAMLGIRMEPYNPDFGEAAGLRPQVEEAIRAAERTARGIGYSNPNSDGCVSRIAGIAAGLRHQKRMGKNYKR